MGRWFIPDTMWDFDPGLGGGEEPPPDEESSGETRMPGEEEPASGDAPDDYEGGPPLPEAPDPPDAEGGPPGQEAPPEPETYSVTIWEWETANDARVCPVCGPLHGQQFEGDGGPWPPLHGGCRCSRYPVGEATYSKMPLDFDSEAGATRRW